MNRESNHADCTKPYEPPKLTTISLRPEEAVLGHCKTSTVSGSVNVTCTILGACSSIGS